MGQLKGIAMKAGHLMSYLDLQLPPEILSALAVLQTHSPPIFLIRFGIMSVRRLSARANWYRLERQLVALDGA